MAELMFRIMPGEVPEELTFQALSAENEILLAGGTFNDREGCIAAIRVVIDLLSDAASYRIAGESEGVILEFISPEGRLLARSRPVGDEAAATALRDRLVEAASEQEEYEIDLPATAALQSRTGSPFLNSV